MGVCANWPLLSEPKLAGAKYKLFRNLKVKTLEIVTDPNWFLRPDYGDLWEYCVAPREGIEPPSPRS